MSTTTVVHTDPPEVTDHPDPEYSPIAASSHVAVRS